MKKLLPLLLVLVLLFSACAPTDPAAQTTDTSAPPLFPVQVQSSSVGGGAQPPQNFRYAVTILSDSNTPSDVISPYYISRRTTDTLTAFEDVETPALYTLSLGKQSVVGTHVQRLRYTSGEITNVFVSSDEKWKYQLGTSRNFYAISVNLDSSGRDTLTMSAFPQDVEFTEEALKAHALRYIATFVDESVFADYVYSCTTLLYHSTGSNEKDRFVLMTDDTLTETGVWNAKYTITYSKYHNGCETGDYILVYCRSNGDIQTMKFMDYGVDWTQFPIDLEQINPLAEAYISDAIEADCTLENLELRSQTLLYQFGEIRLICWYGVRVGGAERVSFLCPVLVQAIVLR